MSDDAPDAPEGRCPTNLQWWLRLSFVLAIAHAIFILVAGISEPLVDLHSFRQTQTALTTFWIAKGGPLFAYETPVAGAPWAIPFEFPLFQYIVASVARMGVPLDAAGRGTAFAFYIFSLIPMRFFFQKMRIPGPTFLMTAILFLTCPMLLYWSRTFLIESCAVFFGIVWLACLVSYTDSKNKTYLVSGFLAQCLLVLIKLTTFPAFAFVATLLIFTKFRRDLSYHGHRSKPDILLMISCAIPLVVGYMWVGFTDRIKDQNHIGQYLDSTSLFTWNFGSLHQRFGLTLWNNTVWSRAIPDVLGAIPVVAFMVISFGLLSRRHLAGILSSLFSFILPFLIFSNLHIHHNYYQAANAVFLVAAVGIAMAWLATATSTTATMSVLSIIVVGQLTMFYLQFYPVMRLSIDASRLAEVAIAARDQTKPSSRLIVIGDDWSSLVPYYAQRKSLALPSWLSPSEIQTILDRPARFLDDGELGGVVYCEDKIADYKGSDVAIRGFLNKFDTTASVSGCSFLRPRL